MPYSNWKAGHGEGNCSYIITGSINDTDDLSNGLWGSTETCYDQSPRRVCTVCEFHGRTKNWYNLRGLCSESRHDKKFTLESDSTAKPFLKGLSTSIIKWVSYLAIPTHNSPISCDEYLSPHRFWPCHENGLIKMIQPIPNNLYVSFKSASLYCGLG